MKKWVRGASAGRVPCETIPQPLLLTGLGIRGGFTSASIDWEKATSPGHLATQDQSGKGLASEFVSSDPNTAGGQAAVEGAMKYS